MKVILLFVTALFLPFISYGDLGDSPVVLNCALRSCGGLGVNGCEEPYGAASFTDPLNVYRTFPDQRLDIEISSPSQLTLKRNHWVPWDGGYRSNQTIELDVVRTVGQTGVTFTHGTGSNRRFWIMPKEIELTAPYSDPITFDVQNVPYNGDGQSQWFRCSARTLHKANYIIPSNTADDFVEI